MLIQLKTLILTNAYAKKDFKWMSLAFVTAVTRKSHIGTLKLGNAYAFLTFSMINFGENVLKRAKNAEQTNIMVKKVVNVLSLQLKSYWIIIDLNVNSVFQVHTR